MQAGERTGAKRCFSFQHLGCSCLCCRYSVEAGIAIAASAERVSGGKAAATGPCVYY